MVDNGQDNRFLMFKSMRRVFDRIYTQIGHTHSNYSLTSHTHSNYATNTTVNTKLSKATELSNGANLDNQVTEGFYYQGVTNNTSNMTGLPVRLAFMLVVEKGSGSTIVKQTFTEYTKSNPRIWVRTLNNWGSSPYWGKWKLVYDERSFTLSGYESTNFDSCDIKFYKKGSMVIVTYHINTVSFANTSDHTIVSSSNAINADYRPLNTVYQHITTYNSDPIRTGLITINTDGTMKIRVHKANEDINTYGSFCYPVKGDYDGISS